MSETSKNPITNEPTDAQQRTANHFYMTALRFLSDCIKELNPKEQPERIAAMADVVSDNLTVLGLSRAVTDEQAEFLAKQLNHALHVFIEERMKELQ